MPIINFDDIAPMQSSYTESGYVFSTPRESTGLFIKGEGHPGENKSLYEFPDDYTTQDRSFARMQSESGSAFEVKSIDLDGHFNNLIYPTLYEKIVGNFKNGSTITAELPLDRVDGFQNFKLTGFINIISLDIYTGAYLPEAEIDNIEITNFAPIANDDVATVLQRKSVSGNVLTGGTPDSDPENAALGVTTISFHDVDTAVTSEGATIHGNHGTLVVNTNGSYTYVADVEGRIKVGETATDSFTYGIADNENGSATAHLTITVGGSSTGTSGGDVFNLTGSGRTASGGAGNDTYVIDDGDDRAVEQSGQGTDLVKALASHTLGADVENLTLYGTTDLDGTGNALSNVIRGNGGDNRIAGKLGNDTLSGGGGEDTFVFDTGLGPTNVDHIRSFSVRDDTIELSKSIFTQVSSHGLTAETFKDVTDPATQLDADDRIVYDHASGMLWYDSDGSGAGAKVQFAILDNHPTLTFQDFHIA